MNIEAKSYSTGTQMKLELEMKTKQ